MTVLLIAGAGGHGRVVADCAFDTGRWSRIAFLDDASTGNTMDWTVVGKTADAPSLFAEFRNIVVAIGDNRKRLELLRHFAKLGYELPSIIHPSACVSKRAVIEPGTVVFAQSAVNIGCRIGLGCIINTGVTVDHDCILGEGVHLSPGVHLAGEVTIGAYTWLGTGAAVINRIKIGEKSVIGAGSVIVNDIGDNVTVVGVPGRVIKSNA